MKINLDIKKLLSEISHENKTGLDLRHHNSDLFQKIKDARNHARSVERKNLLPSSFSSKKEWSLVFKICVETLLSETKDIELVSILIESLLRLKGFLGLAEGFELATHLIEQYGDALHPLSGHGELQDKFSSFAQLNGWDKEGTLISPIALLPLTAETKQGAFSLWQYQQAIEFSQKNNSISVDEYPNLDKIILAVQETSLNFFDEIMKSISSAINYFLNLSNCLETLCGEASPPMYRIKTQLEACLSCVSSLSHYGKKSVKDDKTQSANPINLNEIRVSDQKAVVFDSRITALRAIEEASLFFRKTEPHSPIPYLLEKALLWGKMTFPDLLSELVHDEVTRRQIYQLTGIKEK